MRYSTARAPDASPLECSRGFCNGLLAVLLLWLAACDELNSRGIAARVEGWDLGEDRLAELIILGQPFPLDSAAVSQLARHWEAAAALSFRFAAGDSLLGDEARAASLWLDRREAVLTADREERLGRAVGLDAAGVAGAFEEGSLRLAAHILRRVGPETSSSERLLQRRTTERLLNTLIEGGSWTQVVAESEDPSSRGRRRTAGSVCGRRTALDAGPGLADFGARTGLGRGAEPGRFPSRVPAPLRRSGTAFCRRVASQAHGRGRP